MAVNEASIGSLAFSIIGRASGIKTATRHAAMSLNHFAHRAERSSNRIQASMAGLGVVSVAALAASTAAFASFDEQMKRSTSLFEGLTDELYRNMSTQAKRFAVEQGRSAQDIAGSYYYLASAGFDAAESLELLPKVLQFATASNLTAAKATELLSDATFALGLRSRDTAKQMENMTYVSDIIMKATMKADATAEQFATGLSRRAGPMVQAFGVDVRDATAALMVFANQGIKGSQASTFLGIAIREITRAAGANREEWKRLGIQVFDSTGKMRRFEEIFSDMRKTFRGIADEDLIATLRNMGIRARAAQPIIALMTSVDDLRRNVSDLNDVSDVTRNIWETRLQSLTVLGRRFAESIKVIGINIGEAFASPGMQSALETMIRGFQRLGDFIGNIDKTFLALTTAFVGLVGGLLIAGKTSMFVIKSIRSLLVDLGLLKTKATATGPSMEATGNAALTSARKMAILSGQNKRLANTLGMLAKSGTRFTDMMIKLTAQVGGLNIVSGNIVQLSVAASDSSIEISILAKAVGALGRAMAGVNAVAVEFVANAQRLGTSVVKLHTKFKSKSTVINNTANALRNMASAVGVVNKKTTGASISLVALSEAIVAFNKALSRKFQNIEKVAAALTKITKALHRKRTATQAATQSATAHGQAVQNSTAVAVNSFAVMANSMDVVLMKWDLMLAKANLLGSTMGAATAKMLPQAGLQWGKVPKAFSGGIIDVTPINATTKSIGLLGSAANKTAGSLQLTASAGAGAGAGKAGLLSMAGGGLMAAGFKVMAIAAVANMAKWGIDAMGRSISGDETWDSADATMGWAIDLWHGTNKQLASIERHNAMIAKHGLTYNRLSRALRDHGTPDAKQAAQEAHAMWAAGRGEEAISRARRGVADAGIKIENKELNATIANALREMQNRDVSAIQILETSEVAELRKSLDALKEEYRRANMTEGARMAEDVGRLAMGRMQIGELMPKLDASTGIAQRVQALAATFDDLGKVATAISKASIDEMPPAAEAFLPLANKIKEGTKATREALAQADVSDDYRAHVSAFLDGMDKAIPNEDAAKSLVEKSSVYVDQMAKVASITTRLNEMPAPRDWKGWGYKNLFNLVLAPMTGGVTAAGVFLDKENKDIEAGRARLGTELAKVESSAKLFANEITGFAVDMNKHVADVAPTVQTAAQAATHGVNTLKDTLTKLEKETETYVQSLKGGTESINNELKRGYEELMDSIVGHESKDVQIARVRSKIEKQKKNVEAYAKEIGNIDKAGQAINKMGKPDPEDIARWQAQKDDLFDKMEVFWGQGDFDNPMIVAYQDFIAQLDKQMADTVIDFSQVRAQLESAGGEFFKGKEFDSLFDQAQKEFAAAADSAERSNVWGKWKDVFNAQLKNLQTEPKKAMLDELGKLDKETNALKGLTETIERMGGQAASVVERGSVEAYRAERGIGRDYQKNIDRNTGRTADEVQALRDDIARKLNLVAI